MGVSQILLFISKCHQTVKCNIMLYRLNILFTTTVLRSLIVFDSKTKIERGIYTKLRILLRFSFVRSYDQIGSTSSGLLYYDQSDSYAIATYDDCDSS